MKTLTSIVCAAAGLLFTASTALAQDKPNIFEQFHQAPQTAPQSQKTGPSWTKYQQQRNVTTPLAQDAPNYFDRFDQAPQATPQSQKTGPWTKYQQQRNVTTPPPRAAGDVDRDLVVLNILLCNSSRLKLLAFQALKMKREDLALSILAQPECGR